MLTQSQIERVAKRLFAQHIWIEKYGKSLYFLRGSFSPQKILPVKTLADEWDIIQFNRRWFVYLSSDKKGISVNQTRNKLSPLDIQKIRDTDFSVKGVQRTLAKELGVHESHLSRVRRGIRRADVNEPTTFSDKDKAKLFVSRTEVDNFFSIMLTGTEFYNKYHKTYDIKYISRVYDMCSGRSYGKLPNGWLAVRVSDVWLIYSKSSLTSQRDSSPS